MNWLRSLRATVLCLVCCATATAVTSAGAQSANSLDSITAEALFDDGVRLMGLEQYEQACPRLQQSYELDPGIGTLLYLGDCYRSLGKTASAWMAFREAAFAAGEAGQREREKTATEYAEALRPQLIQLRLQMESVPREAHLVFDGHPLRTEIIDVPFAVDPGRHTVELSAPGRKSLRKVIELENKPGVVVVGVPQLKPSPPPVVEREPVQPQPQPQPPRTQQKGYDSLGWTLLGAGASAIAVGGGLALLDDSTRTGIGVAVGGVLSAGAGALVLFRPAAGEVQIAFSPNPHGGALIAGGAF